MTHSARIHFDKKSIIIIIKKIHQLTNSPDVCIVVIVVCIPVKYIDKSAD